MSYLVCVGALFSSPQTCAFFSISSQARHHPTQAKLMHSSCLWESHMSTSPQTSRSREESWCGLKRTSNAHLVPT
jgi:hypothetical protein